MTRNLSNQTLSNSDDEILYLFTSTWQPYIKDALDLLALPSGLSYRFRYDIRHLRTDLFIDTEKTQLKNMNGLDAFLIHVRTKPKNQTKSIYPEIIESIPIRKAKVIEAKLVGDFVWFHFLLGAWIKYSEPKSTSINPYHNTIQDILPADSKNNLAVTAILTDRKKIDCLCSTLHEDQDAVITNWSNLVSYIRSFKEHENSIFLKFLKIKASGESDVKLPTNLGDDTFGFELDSGKTFQIHILQRYYETNSEVPFFLKVNTNENHIIQIKSSDQIQGKYDVLRFTITSEPLLRSQQSFLNILPSIDLAHTMISKPFYNVKIKPSIPHLFRSIIIIVSGITLVSISPNFEETLGNYSVLPSIFGAVITALGGFWLPKK